MEHKVNTSDFLLMKLRKEGKMEQLNTKAYIKTIQKMNERLENHRRDFKVKEMNSIESASKSILIV